MCSKSNLVFVVVLTITLCGLAAFPCTGQNPEHPDLQRDHQPASEKFLLKWKFAPGDVIRVRHRTIKSIEEESNAQRQEHTFRYSWAVQEVSKDGTAKVSLSFEDVAFTASDPPVEFHTATDDVTTTLAPSEDQISMMYQARAMANSAISFDVLPNGGTLEIRGAESLSDVRSHTPGDLPALPSHPVAVGESWKVPAGHGPMKGVAECKLIGVEQTDGRKIARIECVVNWRLDPVEWSQLVEVQFEPTKSVGRFDIEAGRFLDVEMKSGFRVLQFRLTTTDNKEEAAKSDAVQVVTEQWRRMAKGERPTLRQPMSGRNVLVFHDDHFQSVIAAGVPTRKPTDPSIDAKEIFGVEFFHRWDDEDGDDLPSSTEIRGVSTRFTAEERVKFLASFIGMQSRRIRFEIIDSSGQNLVNNEIPVRQGPAAIAVRDMRLPAGVYFYEFYVDDELVLRVPVQVFADLESQIHAQTVPMRVDPTEFRLRVAIQWKLRQQLDRALQELNRALIINDRDSRLYILRADVYREQGDRAKAEQDYTTAIEIGPKDAHPYAIRGMIRMADDKLDLALEDFNKAIEIGSSIGSSEDAVIYSARGLVHAGKKRFDQAIADFNAAIRLAPNRPDPRMQRARALFDSGNYDQAILGFEELIELAPNHVGGHYSLARALATCPDREFRDAERAIAHATRACELSEWKAHAPLVALAAAYAEAGDRASAIRWQTKAIEVAPDNAVNDARERLKTYQTDGP